MENCGVKCNVCECSHNVASAKCNLQTITITHDDKASDAVKTPHFCKEYVEKK